MLEELKVDVLLAYYKAKEKALFALVWALPRRVVEIATVRCWANATSGPFATESPTEVTIDAALRRWMRKEGGDKTFRPSEVYY